MRMKILFLQKVDNARGGIASVNLKLMSYFLSLGHQVDVLSVRHGDSWETVNYPQSASAYLINETDVWGCPRLKDALAYFKKVRFVKGLRLLISRVIYDKKMASDYAKCQNVIEELKPDVIINSHYEVLQGINDKYLKKTIMHFHTSFDQVLANSSYLRIFKQYASKIHKFVWLSEKTKEAALRCGFDNSVCIYNPLPFSEERSADMSNKKMVFIGRLSEEKRVHLAIEYFKEVVRENDFYDWTFEIYGDGELTETVEAQVSEETQVFYKGRTEQVKETLLQASLLVLTSCFEGMPIVVLEANECGVPALIYDFGESSGEVVINGETGVIVTQNDKQAFKAAMKETFEHEEYRRKMSNQAKIFAKQFSIENIGQKWLQLFEEMRM